MTCWYEGPLAAFDTETTGVDVERDRIVSAALVVQDGPGSRPRATRWLVNPGISVPEGATAVHGLTDEHLQRNGRWPAPVMEEVARALAEECAAGRPLVVMNAPFDLSLLDAECARHCVPTVAARIGTVAPVVDPLVLDRAADKYRKGRRNLESLAKHYGVQLDDAHTADADAGAALQVALRIAERHEKLQVPARILHGWQVQWHEAWAANYEAFLRKTKPSATVDRGWPLRPVGGDAS